jgi:hypothetical protein
MARVTLVPIFDIHHSEVVQPEGPSDQFANIQRDDDMMRWMGRGSTFELPEGGEHGAGGNADGDHNDDPIVHLHEKAKKSFHITGPADVTGEGSTPVTGKKGR